MHHRCFLSVSGGNGAGALLSQLGESVCVNIWTVIRADTSADVFQLCSSWNKVLRGKKGGRHTTEGENLRKGSEK